jgi:hypothetical protein
MTTDAVTSAPLAAPVRLSLARVAAGLALASAAVHLLLISAGELGTVVMAGMALACLPCAWHLWRRPTPGVWGMTAAVDVGMLALHAPMLASTGHHASAPAALMWTGLALVLGQLALATAATVRR